jgi:hypothetical protein
MSELKEYYITTVRNYKIKDIDTIFKTPSNTRPSYENEWFPDRVVTASFLGSFERIGSYFLTEDEVRNLTSDPNILAIEDLSLFPTESVDEGSIRGNFRLYPSPSLNEPLPPYPTHLKYHSLPKDQAFSGSLGSKTMNLIGGLTDTNTSIPASFVYTSSYNYKLDGTGVDIIIFESFNDGFFHKHAEFYNLDGECRIQYISWRDYVTSKGSYDSISGSYYKNTTSSTYQHGMVMASLAAGLTSGVAKNANIYFLKNGLENSIVRELNIIKNFHTSKSINLNTGYKRPTIVNQSFRGFTFYALSAFETGSKVSGSFELTNIKPNDGIRIAHVGPDLFFISSSNLTTSSGNFDSFLIPDGNYWKWNRYNFTSSISVGLINAINSSGYFTASYNNNILSITSSYNYYTPIKIYTGSINDFLLPSGKGGSFICEVSGGVLSKTNISKIVTKGQTVYEGGNNGIPKCEYGFTEHPPYDPYGIDRGLNTANYLFDPLIDSIFKFRAIDNFEFNGSSLPNTTAVKTAMLELAQAGVILVKSAGNHSHYTTNESLDSDPDNPFYDSKYFSQDLWDTYIEYSPDVPLDLKSPPQPNTPYRVLCTGDYNNYTSIQASELNLTLNPDRYTFDDTSPRWYINGTNYTVRGPGVDVYVGGGGITTFNSGLSEGSFMYYSSSHPLYKSINFNTASVNNLFLTVPYLSQSLKTSNGPLFDTTTGILNSLGSSGAAAITTGIIALYLQINPGADLKQVRNWLYENSNKVIINNNNLPFLYRYDYSASNGQYYDSYRRTGTTYLGGRDGGILHNPYGLTPNQATFSNIQITKS